MRKPLIALGLVVAFLFAAYVWPTQWRYERITIRQYEYLVRFHRFNEKAERFRDGRWVPVRASSALSYDDILRDVR